MYFPSQGKGWSRGERNGAGGKGMEQGGKGWSRGERDGAGGKGMEQGGKGWSRGEQGWRSGESARLPPLWPGFDYRTRRHMWVEFVGSRSCFKGFSPGSPVFLPPQKSTLQIPIRSGNEGHRFVSFAVKCYPY